MKIGYWAIRGIAQPIRYLLEYAEADYEEVRYTAPEADKWFAGDKENLGLDFPNLPYLLDGDMKITQSRAVLLYVTKKYQMAGSSGAEEIRALNAHDAFVDFRTKLLVLANGPNWDEEKGNFVGETVPLHLKRFEKLLAKHKWLGGTQTPSYVDFTAYDTLDQLYLLSPPLMEKFPKLKALFDRVDSLPQIQAYKKRAAGPKSFIDTPFYWINATFGATRD